MPVSCANVRRRPSRGCGACSSSAPERIELETGRHRMVGNVTLAPNGFRTRVSDLLNASEREFIALTDVTITPLDGGEYHPARVRGRLAAAHRVRDRCPTAPSALTALAAVREGFEPLVRVDPVTRLPVAPVQPLRHLSRSSDSEG